MKALSEFENLMSGIAWGISASCARQCQSIAQSRSSACLQITSWVLWNATAVCMPLCQAIGSSAQQAADVAQRVLAGTLEALQRGGIAGHLDPRAR